jgi:hypothetical protein
MTIRIALCTLLALGAAGCATDSEPEFGSSVRHMIIGQSYDPAAPRDELGAADGAKTAKAIEAYHAGKKQATKSPPASLIMPTAQ